MIPNSAILRAIEIDFGERRLGRGIGMAWDGMAWDEEFDEQKDENKDRTTDEHCGAEIVKDRVHWLFQAVSI